MRPKTNQTIRRQLFTIKTGNTTMKSNEILSDVKAKFGFVPNVLQELARSPIAAKVYLQGQDAMGGATLSAKEQQVVSLAISTANKCAYCQSAHRTAARKMGVSEEDLSAIETGHQLPADERLAGLVLATRRLAELNGWLEPHDLNELEGMGVNRIQLYEIIAVIGLKTITNYVNHIAHVPIDPQFGG